MAKTVGTLAYMITADTRNFTDGVVRTRKETNALKWILEATATPAQRFADSMSGLEALRGKGLDDASYARAVAQLNKEFTVTAEVVNPLKQAMVTLGPAMAAFAVAGVGVAVGLKAIHTAASFVVSEVTEAYERLDVMAQKADKLGVTVAAFQDLSFAAELADVGIDEVSKSMDQMLNAVSKGGDKKFANAFAMLGLDPKALKEMRPEQMFREVLTAMEQVRSQADRTRLAKTIFGDTDVLRLHVDSLDEASGLLATIGGHMSDLDVKKLADMDTEWTQMKLVVDALAQRVAADLAPAFTDLARTATGLLVDLATNETLSGALKEMSATMRGMTASASEFVDLLTVGMGKMSEGAAGQGLGHVLGLSTGFKVGKTLFDVFGGVGKDIQAQEKIGAELDQKLKDIVGKNAGPLGITGGSDGASALDKDIDKWFKDLESSATSALSSIQTPLEKFNDAMGELALMLNMGLIDESQFEAIGKKLESELPGNKLIDSLKEQLKELQLTTEGFALYKAGLSDVTSAEHRQAKALQASITEQKRVNDLQKDAKAAVEGLKTPYEQVQAEIAKYAEMLEREFIDMDQFKALREKSIDKFKGSQQQQEFRNPAAMRGSQEAIAMLANARFGSQGRLDEIAETLKNIEGHLEKDEPVELQVIPSFGR